MYITTRCSDCVMAKAVLDEAGVLFDQDEEESQIEEFREFLNQVRPEDFAAE